MAVYSKVNGFSFYRSLKGLVLVIFLTSTLTYSIASKQGKSCFGCRFLPWLKKVCCSNECIRGSNCVGHTCKSFADCYTSESCCNAKCKDDVYCRGEFCTSDSDCGRDGHCCLNSFDERKCSDNCIGSPCWKGTDCAPNEYCCSNVCSASRCVVCNTDSDCGSVGLRCCQGICQSSNFECIDQTVVICSTIGLIGFLCLFCLMCDCVCRRYRRRCVQLDGTNSWSGDSWSGGESLPPYPTTQDPPPYDRTCPDSPPPEYEQEERTLASQYTLHAQRTSKPPPPYSEERIRISGCEHSVCSIYGAVERSTT